jgi:hypothetical protein
VRGPIFELSSTLFAKKGLHGGVFSLSFPLSGIFMVGVWLIMGVKVYIADGKDFKNFKFYQIVDKC